MTRVVLDKASWSMVILVTTIVGFSGCHEESKVGDSHFKAGREALIRGEYQPAIEQLQTYLQQNPHGKLASRASFLIAKAELGLGNNEEARRLFEKTVALYASSEEAHKSLYKLAMLSFIQGELDDAHHRFEQLAMHPSGPLAPEAAAMLRYLNANKDGGDQ